MLTVYMLHTVHIYIHVFTYAYSVHVTYSMLIVCILLERINEVHMLHTVHMLKTYSTHVYIRMLTVHVTYNTHVTCNTHVTYIGYCYTTKTEWLFRPSSGHPGCSPQ